MPPRARAHPRVVIVGSGFGGLCMAIQLKRAGIDSFTVLAKAHRLGGVWPDNTDSQARGGVPRHQRGRLPEFLHTLRWRTRRADLGLYRPSARARETDAAVEKVA